MENFQHKTVYDLNMPGGSENQLILILDFGGQYKQLIARRVRESGVYSEIRSGAMTAEQVKALAPIGIILTGGPDSVYLGGSPKIDAGILKLGIPVLGICYGLQLIAYTLGGKVEPGTVKEYGRTAMTVNTQDVLFSGLESAQTGLMSHTDIVSALPAGFVSTAHTDATPNAAIADEADKIYGVQFHPEVEHTDHGREILHNFVYRVCGATGDYSMDDYLDRQIKKIRGQVGCDRVLLGLSGGVDSSVCAALLSRAIPGQLVCIFVDHGFMRKNEGDEIEAAFAHRSLDFIRVNAGDRFLAALSGVTDPEQKRKIIGRLFVEEFQAQAKLQSARVGNIRWLAQGTIYPDVIESGAYNSATIKSHHNVGGLPKDIDFAGIIEPLRGLFKDEVRALGRRLELPAEIVERQPFPGPGLAIRIIGELTKEKCDTLREADAIFRYEMKRANVAADQYFAVLTNIRSVGVMGDSRTYDYTVALRAVRTVDFMTAQYCRIPYEVLDIVSERIVNEVPGVNRVVYDVTGKPPSTIEWE